MKEPPANSLAGGQHGCDTPVLLSSVEPITPDCLPIFGCCQENCAQESAEHYLLRLRVAADNAAMETEPTKAGPPKRKRRWFQFSLRTLMVVMAIVAVQCAVCLPMLREWKERDEYRRELVLQR